MNKKLSTLISLFALVSCAHADRERRIDAEGRGVLLGWYGQGGSAVGAGAVASMLETEGYSVKPYRTFWVVELVAGCAALAAGSIGLGMQQDPLAQPLISASVGLAAGAVVSAVLSRALLTDGVKLHNQRFPSAADAPPTMEFKTDSDRLF